MNLFYFQNVFFYGPLTGTEPGSAQAQYLLLEPHYIFDTYLPEGTIVTAGTQVPLNWIPTLAVDPLNSNAVTAYYNAGPRGAAWQENFSVFENLYRIPNKPVTYWVPVPGPAKTFTLTGLGVGFKPKG